MLFDKPFTNYNFQLQRLKSRGMIIPSSTENETINRIRSHGYYQVINGYGDQFEVNSILDNEKRYAPDSTFNNVYNLFSLDRQLGKLIFPFILDIEEHFTNEIAYTVAKHFDVNNYYKDDADNRFPEVKSYLDVSRYPNAKTSVLKELHELSTTTKKYPTVWYRKNKNHIPPWILFMNADLGTMNQLFKILPSNLKNEINAELLPNNFNNKNLAIYLKNISVEERNRAIIEKTNSLMFLGMELMRTFRNSIAHNSRTLGFHSEFKLPTILKNATKTWNLYTAEEYSTLNIGKNDIYALIIWIVLLQNSKKEALHFLNQLRTFFKKEQNQNQMNKFMMSNNIPVDFYKRLTTFINNLGY